MIILNLALPERTCYEPLASTHPDTPGSAEMAPLDTTGYPVSASPGLELYNCFGSKGAKDPGSNNYMVLQNPAVDTLITGLVKAESKATNGASHSGMRG